MVFFSNNAFCEAYKKDTCHQIYSELKTLRENIRTLMGDKTAFDKEKDKPLFDAYLKYDELYKKLYAEKCLPLPLLRKTDEIKETTSLYLFFINSVQYFLWALEYKNKGVSLNELFFNEKKVPEQVKACLFKFDELKMLNSFGDSLELVISCPFAQIEKSWELNKYKITQNGEPIKNGIVFTKEELGKNYTISWFRFCSDLSSIKLEPEIKAWFDKEMGTLRGLIK
jgi:hypothetical protein